MPGIEMSPPQEIARHARRQALDEAAKLAEEDAEYMRRLRDEHGGESGIRCDVRARSLDAIARKIRALRDKE